MQTHYPTHDDTGRRIIPWLHTVYYLTLAHGWRVAMQTNDIATARRWAADLRSDGIETSIREATHDQ